MSLVPMESPPPPPPPQRPLVAPAEVYRTWNGHRKVVTEHREKADPEDGLSTVHFSTRVVRKDLWHEQSQALERRALENAPARFPTRRRRPVRKVGNAEGGATGEPTAPTPSQSPFAEKKDTPPSKSKSMRFLVPEEEKVVEEEPEVSTPAKVLPTKEASTLAWVKAQQEQIENESEKETKVTEEKPKDGKDGEDGMELSRSLGSHLGVASRPSPDDRGAPKKTEEATVYDMNGLPYKNLNKATGGVSEMTRSSLRALELSAATQPSNYGGSAASGADNKLTVDLLSERDSVAGEPVAVPVKSAFSDDASSLKSLEYSQNFADVSRQDLAWQAQLSAAAAAAADPEITMEEISRLGEHHTDVAKENRQVRKMSARGAAPAYSAKSFLQRAANKSRKSFKQKAGWQNLSESAEYRVTPAGVLEVRKKGMWDMSEEERQRRLRKELPLKKRFQMGLARLFGWDQDLPYLKPEKKLDPLAARKEATTVRKIDFARIVQSETLQGHSGTVKSVIVFGNRVVSGGSDGQVCVWRNWEEVRAKIRKKASMRETKSMLERAGLDLASTSMFAGHGGDDDSLTEEEDSVCSRGPQRCEWILHQVMDHGSAITAMAQAKLEVEEHRLNEPLLAVATRSGSLFLWATSNPLEWECAKEIRVSSVLLCLIFHEGRLVAGCDDGTVHAWRLGDMEHGIIEGHSSAVWSLASSDDHLFTGSSDGVMKVWQHDEDDDSYDHRVTVKCKTGGVWSISDRTEVVTAADDTMIHVIVKSDSGWDLTKTFEHGHRGPVVSQQVVNVDYLLTCSPGRGARVKAWNRNSWECVWQVSDEMGPCWCVLHTQSSILVGGGDKAIHIFRSYYPTWLYDKMEADKDDHFMPDADSVFGDHSPNNTAKRRGQSTQSTAMPSPQPRAQPRTSFPRGDSLPAIEQCESPSRTKGRPRASFQNLPLI